MNLTKCLKTKELGKIFKPFDGCSQEQILEGMLQDEWLGSGAEVI